MHKTRLNNHVFNKNLLNNQNYVINRKLKISVLLDFFMKKNTIIFPLNLILLLNKFISIKILSNFYTNKRDLVTLFMIHTILAIFLLPVLLFSSFFYFIIYVYISFIILNAINDFNISNIYIMGPRRSRSLSERTYLKRFVNYISVGDNVMTNSSWAFIQVLMFSSFVFWFYLVFNLIF